LATKQLAVASQQRTVSHFFFNRVLSTKNKTVFPHPPYFYLFPRLNVELRSYHFHTIKVIAAESQAVLNTLTQHDFRDAFKEMAEALGTVHARGRGLLRG
jgi:hypothetical protein